MINPMTKHTSTAKNPAAPDSLCGKKEKSMTGRIFAFAILFLFPTVCLAISEIVVFKGIPVVQNKSSVEESVNFQLSDSQQSESRSIITRKGQKYFWTSRQDRELTRHESGIYTIFLETRGAGYVKVMRSADKVLYMEHMGLGLETITYWGVADYLGE